jgi:hypothetical protein
VLDHVERRRFLVEPARKDAAQALVAALHVDLNERAGQFLLLPRRGGFARLEANDHVLPPRRLAGVEGDVLDDPVAFVEHSQDRDPLGHWRDIALARAARRRLLHGGLVGLLGRAAARRNAEDQQQGKGALHAYSGIHGS